MLTQTWKVQAMRMTITSTEPTRMMMLKDHRRLPKRPKPMTLLKPNL